MLSVVGSIRANTPLGLVTIHTLPAPAVIPPSESAGPAGILATTFCVFKSTLTRLWSAQLGTHRLPKPTARPEQGFGIVTDSPTWLVTAFRRVTELVDELVTQTESAVSAIQSGWPPTCSVASGCRPVIRRWIAGSLTPVVLGN